MSDNDIIKAWDILDKFEFFGGQRAGRELWYNKPTDIQNKDIGAFLRDVDFLKDFIKSQKAEIERLNNCVKSEDEVRAIMKDQMTPMVREIVNEQIDKAIKLTRIEFAEKVKAINGNEFLTSWYESADICYEFNQEEFEAYIDNLLEEMESES